MGDSPFSPLVASLQHMIRLVYSSAARAGMDEAELKRILDGARTRNARREVTGMLLYRDGVFLQLLEGQEVDVRFVYSRIAQDPRHHRVVKLIEETIAQRDFASWSMGYQVLTATHLNALSPPDPVRPVISAVPMPTLLPCGFNTNMEFNDPISVAWMLKLRLAAVAPPTL
jgi:hypothetical protein